MTKTKYSEIPREEFSELSPEVYIKVGKPHALWMSEQSVLVQEILSLLSKHFFLLSKLSV